MKNIFPNICIAIVCICSILIIFNLKNWEKRERVIEWDIHGYYGYLPAKFIYDDIKLEKSDYQFDSDYSLFWPIGVGGGKNAIHKTMGLSILYSPFFFAGHYVSKWLDFPLNGFSEPYKLFLLLSAVFYLFLGLELVRKTLLHLKFTEFHSGLTILILGLGTNMMAYSSQSAPMMHIYNFFLIAVFVYGTLKWFEHPEIKHSVLIGLSAGLISMIYFPNLIIAAFFLAAGYSKAGSLNEFLNFFKKHSLKFILILAAVLMVWIPQFLYWKIVTGKIIFNLPHEGSYFWGQPKFIDGLISWRKGWLVYTPVMIFALAGIFLLRGELKFLRIPIAIFLFLNLYIIFSWWNWWYGGSYGQRALVDSYALLSIPLAAFVRYISSKQPILKISFSVLILFFIWLNLFQTIQYEKSVLHHDSMTQKLYFKQFGKLKKVEDFNDYLVYPNYEEAKNGKR